MQGRKYQFLWLRIPLLLQMTHTVASFAMHVYTLISYTPARYRNSGISGLMERFDWNLTFFLCIAFIFELMLWRHISRKKRFAWNYCAIMAAALTLYVLYIAQFQTGFPNILLFLPPDYILVLALCFGIFGLWKHRGEFHPRRRDFIQIAVSIALAITITYLNGRFFSHLNINYAITLPHFIKMITRSIFQRQEESFFVLLMCCYLLVQTASRFYKPKADRG